MGILNDIFSNLLYSEIKPKFDAMDELFISLIKDFELKVSEETSDETLYSNVEAKLFEWEGTIQRRIEEWNKYIRLSREIYEMIESSIGKDDIEKYRRVADGLMPLRKWINYDVYPSSFIWLLYHNQRMAQLRRIVELYQKDTKGEILTWRHLFEEGLKKERVTTEMYLGIVYDVNESNDYLGYGLQFSLLHPRTGIGRSINWETNNAKAKRIEHQLAVHLKYAELAYNGTPAKGELKDVLDPYVVNYGKYKGTNVKGFFRLQGGLHGFVGSRRNTAKTIIIGFRGTASWANGWSDIKQFFGYLDPAYVEALALLKSVYIGKSHKNRFKNSRIVVCGHSLGGGVMQYAVASMMKKDEITGFGYNSAGLSWKNLCRLASIDYPNIFHLYLPKDVVFKFPSTYHVGKAVALDDCVGNKCKAHRIKVMRMHLKESKYDLARMAV